jgi:hypothetical protein
MTLFRRFLGGLAANLNDPQMVFEPGASTPFPVRRDERPGAAR